MDVTEDVLSTDVTWTLGRAPNTCSITLANNFDKYIFTTYDLKVLFKGFYKIEEAIKKYEASAFLLEEGADDMERPSEEEIDQQLLENAQEIQGEVKRKVITSKIKVRTKNVAGIDISGKVSSLKPLSGDVFRYPLQAEDPIFHPNDPIRIFFRDIFNPKKWYHMFTGLVSDFDDSISENNENILTIVGEGPMRLLRYGRITTNPGIIDIQAIADAERDAVNRTFHTAGFTNLTLPEIIFVSIFGNDPKNASANTISIQREMPDGSYTSLGKLNGIGNFNYRRSVAFEYGPSVAAGVRDPLKQTVIPTVKINSLDEYQSTIDHEVIESDLTEMMVEDIINPDQIINNANLPRRADNGMIDTLSIIDFIGKNPQLYPVDGGRLIMLLPASLHPEINREVMLKDIIDNVALKTEFRSRLGVIYDTLERIDFCFYESPKGDLICEFPLYDFDPNDWSLEFKTPHISIHNNEIRKKSFNVRPDFTTSQGQFVSNTFTTNNVEVTKHAISNKFLERGPFGSRWVVKKKDTINFSRQFSDEKVRTQITAPWYPAQNYPSNVGDTSLIQAPAVITLKHLVPLYGLRLEQTNSKGIANTIEAAKYHANVTLNRMNADSRNIGINAIANWGLWLNRPLFFERRNCIATINSLTHRITWGMSGSAESRINVNHIRGWDGLVDENNEPVYTPLGGTPSQPLDYKLLFARKNNQRGNNTETPE
jgi:hypothetical protein